METVISSCAEAAGAQMSKAAKESMARYTSRFKAPPYFVFDPVPGKVPAPFPGRELPATTYYKTSVRIYARTVLVGLSASK
jgi:hypothetical protein